MANFTRRLILPSRRLSASRRFLFHALAFLAAFVWVQVSVRAAQEVITGGVPIPAQDDAATRNFVKAEEQYLAGLRAADAMLTARMPKEAAKSYARLSLRFGDSQELFTRRFVAQVQSRDFPQATMIVALSRLFDKPLRLADNPRVSRRQLDDLVGNGVVVGVSTEWIAQKAASRLDDKDSLAAVSAWMRLSGDLEKSVLFERRASQLQPSASVLMDSPPEGMREEVVSEEVVAEEVVAEEVVAEESWPSGGSATVIPQAGEIRFESESIVGPVEVVEDVIVLESPATKSSSVPKPSVASPEATKTSDVSKSGKSLSTEKGPASQAKPAAQGTLKLHGGMPD